MKLTKEYLAECDDCVFRNFNQIDGDRKTDRVVERIRIINDFCHNAFRILSVGCGAHEPIDIKAAYAIDVSENSRAYLSQQGWKGEFTIASCDDLPYEAKEMDVAVCSEVIEHLPDLDIVKKTFQELKRVAKKFITTCPDWLGSEPTHKRAFDLKMLEEVTQGINVEIKHIGRYWYVLYTGD